MLKFLSNEDVLRVGCELVCTWEAMRARSTCVLGIHDFAVVHLSFGVAIYDVMLWKGFRGNSDMLSFSLHTAVVVECIIM